MLVETQVLVGQSGAYHMGQNLPTIQVPPTVQAILAARIDRLSPDEKRLLETAAVIGTEVPFALLHAITELSEEALHRGLVHLQAVEFLYETSLFPERVYTFKHALTHEVSYSSLLHERRQVLHARIVEVLETFGDHQLTEQLDRLAHHAFRGEVWDKALLYYRQAGTKAIEQSAYLLCIEVYLLADHIEEANQLALHTLERARDRKERGHEAWSLHLLGETAAQGDSRDIHLAKTYYQQALVLADELGMRPLQAHCHYRLGILYRQNEASEPARAELTTAIEMYREMGMAFWLQDTKAELSQVK